MKEAKSGWKIQAPPENPWARELKFLYDVEDVLSGKISFFQEDQQQTMTVLLLCWYQNHLHPLQITLLPASRR